MGAPYGVPRSLNAAPLHGVVSLRMFSWNERWVPAGRQAPPCSVRSDHSLRVYVFDKDAVTERICDHENRNIDNQTQTSSASADDDDGKWVWLRKKLNSIWNALSEPRCGQFGSESTVLLNEMAELRSHPANVIEVAMAHQGLNLHRTFMFWKKFGGVI
jgi:hypothetical protein